MTGDFPGHFLEHLANLPQPRPLPLSSAIVPSIRFCFKNYWRKLRAEPARGPGGGGSGGGNGGDVGGDLIADDNGGRPWRMTMVEAMVEAMAENGGENGGGSGKEQW